MTARRVGLLGGTFDPIHMGHLDVAAAAQRSLGLTEVLVLPAYLPPHRRSPLTSAFHRFAMVALAVAGRPGWRASDDELLHEPPSYTARTLARFHERGFHPHELFFLIGADAFADIGSWWQYPALLEQAHFAVVSRPRWPVEDLPAKLPQLAGRMVRPEDGVPETPSIFLITGDTTDVSSTAIRQQLAENAPVHGLDPRVLQHIEQHALYRSQTSDRPRATITPS